ncbi:MAG TPA: N-acetylmuramoyl-L-alanine amidase, partial [Hyphomicrobiaceae bacterium]|nr:N-acetylmuramoyl-L-alanine amidase [Hyphomicrobiaceae bacterium]
DTKKTRFVIGLERAAEFQVFALASPNRVIIELPDLKVQLPQPPGSAPVGLVRSFRGGLSAPGRMRIVIDVTGPVVVEKAVIEKPRDNMKMSRLTVDIAAAPSGHRNPTVKRTLQPAFGLGAGNLQPPSPRPAVKPAARAGDRFRQTIVIDPGHGGHDSGAVKHGTVEKEVVLAFALKLREKLEATGRYRVLMTRDDDTFVELDERRAFADRSGAALFIAVHADYASSRASGATIYSLRDSMARDLMRTARGEVKANVLSANEQQKIERVAPAESSAIKAILGDLAVREVEKSQHLTKEFTEAVVSTMGESTTMMSNPDREANFRVLKSVKMPSVLIELAFVSNRADAAKLKSDSWRDSVATSIQRAVDNYFAAHVARLVQ